MGKKNFRLWVAGVWTFLSNCYLTGFAEGRIYTGPLKNICFPGLNCYSCPGAVLSCPIGAVQAVVGSWKYKVSLYMGGFFMIVGALLGRFVCGWLCPFGFFQDLLYKIPFLRKINHFRADGILRWFKYVVLAVFVLLMPMFVVDFTGQGAPAFCKYICPSGTLMGGLPLVGASKSLQAMIGALFEWKVAILVITVVAAVIIYRPFCKYACPLGAIWRFQPRVAISAYGGRVQMHSLRKVRPDL